jgi:hypothetical protein
LILLISVTDHPKLVVIVVVININTFNDAALTFFNNPFVVQTRVFFDPCDRLLVLHSNCNRIVRCGWVISEINSLPNIGQNGCRPTVANHVT